MAEPAVSRRAEELLVALGRYRLLKSATGTLLGAAERTLVSSATRSFPKQADPDGGSKKKARPPPPPPPASVATAGLLIRAAASRVLGLRPGRCGNEFQPLWVTEPRHGKISIGLEGSARSPFPSKDEALEALLDAVEGTTAHLAAEDAKIVVFEMERKEAETRYGQAFCERNGAEGALRLAWFPGAALVELPPGWQLCKTTGACGRISISRGTAEGKKADTIILPKKKQASFRFSIDIDAPANIESCGDTPSSAEVAETDTGNVKVQVKGIDFGEKLGAKQAEVKPKDVTEEDMVVTAHEVSGKIDYNKLVREFGSTLITDELKERVKASTVGKGNVSKLHPWLERGIFFSHRDLAGLLDKVEGGKPFYLYTGRGPSSAAMHLGHLIPFLFTKWLQDAFNVPLVIQMTDDEKFLWKGTYEDGKGDNLMHFKGLTIENCKDIIACGFDRSKTFIFSDLDYVGHMYPNIVRIWKAVTYNTARGAFGFVGESNIGQSAFPAVQAAPSFPSSFPTVLGGDNDMCCLIPCAIDQDPYFRVTRDIAHKLVPKSHPLGGKPALIHAKFFPPLEGATGKMSASNVNSAVYLNDTPERIASKIMEAFSGGRDTAKEQREKGADIEKDVSIQWLRFFLHDDQELKQIESDYASGQGEYWNTGAVKKRLIREVQRIVAEHQERRAKITDDDVREWMRVRKLQF